MSRAGARGRVLVLCAWEPELAALRAELARAPALARRVTTAAVGVGLVEAALGAARAIAERRPGLVIFVGTAGRYDRHVPLASAIVARRIRLVSTAVARDEAYLPEILPAIAKTDTTLRRALARHAPVADVACPVAITRRVALARRLHARTGCAVETLEAFAVARAAVAHEVSFAAVLGIANDVGPRAHPQWRANGAAAAEAACAVVLRWIERTR